MSDSISEFSLNNPNSIFSINSDYQSTGYKNSEYSKKSSIWSDNKSVEDVNSELNKKTTPSLFYDSSIGDSTSITTMNDISLYPHDKDNKNKNKDKDKRQNLDKNIDKEKSKKNHHFDKEKSKKNHHFDEEKSKKNHHFDKEKSNNNNHFHEEISMYSFESNTSINIDEEKSSSSYRFESNKNNNIEHNSILNNKIVIDVAVLCQEYTNIDVTCKDNILNLDEIEVTKEIFQSIFYPYCDNFGINKDFINNNKQILPYISIYPDFRSINKKRFFLLEELIANIERDLNVSRNCFTKDSIIELTSEISSIKTLCDMNCCSVLSSLSWLNIIEIINNYKLIKTCLCDCECSCSKYKAIPVCVVNLIFKTPTPGVKNTIVRLHYKITNLL